MTREPDFDRLFDTVERLQEQDNSDSLNVEINHHLIARRAEAEARDGWDIEREATIEQDDITEAAAAEGDWVIAQPADGPAVETEMSKPTD